ncbi:MAG: PilZ domain-containing protein [Treponema sp.]|jgi:hypothetical protein|nr:PilZ domain-containing protein [Treponema sp.]
MKLLLVLGSDETHDLISLYVKPLGFELIRYSHVLKAMDNIDEADPTGIIVSVGDFPRHWKILVQFVRAERSKDACPIILLKNEKFPLEETSKAFFLGVSGIVSESLNDPQEINRLQSILSRYIPVEEKRKSPRIHIESWHNFGFLVSNPRDNAIISGEIKTISNTGLSFSPTHASMTKDILLNDELPGCSLRVGDRILSPVCKLVRTGRIVSLEFTALPGAEQNFLNKYLEDLPLEDLKHKQGQKKER